MRVGYNYFSFNTCFHLFLRFRERFESNCSIIVSLYNSSCSFYKTGGWIASLQWNSKVFYILRSYFSIHITNHWILCIHYCPLLNKLKLSNIERDIWHAILILNWAFLSYYTILEYFTVLRESISIAQFFNYRRRLQKWFIQIYKPTIAIHISMSLSHKYYEWFVFEVYQFEYHCVLRFVSPSRTDKQRQNAPWTPR